MKKTISENALNKYSNLLKTEELIKFKVKQSIANNLDNIFESTFDTRKYLENKFNVNLYLNQIEAYEAIVNPSIPYIILVMARGGGKTFSVSTGLLGLCDTFSGTPVGIFGPKQQQAMKIIEEIGLIRLKSEYVNSIISHYSTEKIKFKNGSFIRAFSAADQAEIEGFHGVVVMEEASVISNHTVSNRILPMIAWPGFIKVIKLGLPRGKNHFYKSFLDPKYVKIFKKFDQCPLLKHSGVIVVDGIEYPRIVVDRMPISLKKKFFPGHPELWYEGDMTEEDFLSEYMLEWLENIDRELSEEQIKKLFSGTYIPEEVGIAGVDYYFGLDLAGSSDVIGNKTDFTSLTVGKKLENGVKQIVFEKTWKGDTVTQKQEIDAIINPRTGLFKCKYGCADRGFNAAMLDELRALGNNIIGFAFNQTDKLTGKNYKNVIFDHWKWEIDNDRLQYPHIDFVNKNPYFKEGKIQWENIEREIRPNTVNRKISAPDEEGMHDDVACSDCLFVFAADKIKPQDVPAASKKLPNPIKGPKVVK